MNNHDVIFSKTSMELNHGVKPVSTLPCGDPL